MLVAQGMRYVRGAVGIMAFREGDFLLAAHHRSGTTWVRVVLCNIISLTELGGRDVDPILNDVMPELGANSLLKPYPYRTLPRVIKTHRPYTPLFRRVPAIGMIRDPRDVMVSRYHRRRDRWRDFDGSFGEFLRHPKFGLEGWFRHYASWRDRWIITLKYEDMLKDPPREFRRLLGALGARVPSHTLDEALARSSFEQLQRAERARKPGTENEALHFRSGSSGQWLKYFGPEDLDLFYGLARTYGVSVYG